MLRPFTIRDLSLWRSASGQAVFLHPQSLLTQGAGAVMRGAFLSPLSGLSGIFTYVHHAQGNNLAIIGQVAHFLGSPVAYCRFISPQSALSSRGLPDLLDGMLKLVGSRGAHSLIAEVDEDSNAFGALRQNAFSIYARQQIWKMEKNPNVVGRNSLWRHALTSDELAVQILRNGLVPGQVQQFEETKENLDGYVLYQHEQLLAYAEVKRGPRGIWARPFVSLDADPFEVALADLLARLRPRAGRPVYICLRSYQDGLQGPLKKLDAKPGPYLAVMAKRITLPLKVEETRRIPVANRSAEPTTPIHALLPQAREPEWIRYDQTPNYR